MNELASNSEFLSIVLTIITAATPLLLAALASWLWSVQAFSILASKA